MTLILCYDADRQLEFYFSSIVNQGITIKCSRLLARLLQPTCIGSICGIIIVTQFRTRTHNPWAEKQIL